MTDGVQAETTLRYSRDENVDQKVAQNSNDSACNDVRLVFERLGFSRRTQQWNLLGVRRS